MNNIESNKGEIVMYQPDETIRLEVRVENETVWLTQQQMADLFNATKQNVSLHINNIYDEGELEREATVKDYLTVRKEGKRTVRRHVNLYNLDVIISVGYRVKSIRGTRFRQWANRILKEYLLNGYSINRRFEYIEQRLASAEQKIDFFVRSSLPPVEGIFYDGQIFDAYAHIVNLIKQAKTSIVLVDNYVNVDTLTMLSNRSANVSATIYIRQQSQNMRQLQLDIQRHNQQYPPITVNEGCRQEALRLYPHARDISPSPTGQYQMKFLFFIVIQPIVTMRTPLNTFHVFFLRLTKVLWSRWHVNVGGF